MSNSISSAAISWLLTYAIHSTALLSLAWLLVRVRPWPPAASDLLWKSAMLGGLLTSTIQLQLDLRPAGTLSLHRAEAVAATPVPSADPSPGTRRDQRNATLDARTADCRPERSEGPACAPAAQVTPPAKASIAPATLAVIAWAVIALALALTYIARRLILVGRLGDRRAVPDGRVLSMLEELARDAGLRRAPRLTCTDRISSPIALGVREICLPATALSGLDLEQQRSMLAHELAHLARRDPLWLAFASVLERVFWFQPLNRLARRQIATSAEFLCDDWAVRRAGSGVALARCLAQVAKWIQASPLGVPVAGMAEERSLLVSRVARLLEGGIPASRSRRGLALGAAVVMIAAIAVLPGVSGRSSQKLFAEEQKPTSLPQFVNAPDAQSQSASNSDTESASASASVDRNTTPHALTRADSAVVLALIARLKDENADVRAAAARSLGKLEDPRAVPGLIGALKDAEAKVRAAAAESLGEFKDPRAIAALSALLSDPSTEVKQHALEALSGYEEGVPTEGIVRALSDADAEIRHKAAHLVGEMKIRSASGALARLVRDSSPDVRQAAIRALAELRDQSAATVITGALTDANPDVRQQAINALSELRAPIAEATLLALLRDQNADVRAHAAELAGQRQVVASIPVLRRMLEDPNGDVREHAVEALSNIADSAANDALRAALTSKDAKVRRAAAEALGERRQ